jgi:hypothetical protein
VYPGIIQYTERNGVIETSVLLHSTSTVNKSRFSVIFEGCTQLADYSSFSRSKTIKFLSEVQPGLSVGLLFHQIKKSLVMEF